MPTNADEVVADNGTGAGTASRRGAGYTATEDMLACKAFIVASEDSQKGTSQKGKEFKATMFAAYKLLIREQLECDKKRWADANAAARELMSEPTVYEDRSPESLHNRLKDHVFPRVMKFLGIEETTKQDSGSDAERFYQKCKALFEKRYPQFGNPDCFKACKEYLQTKPKFASYRRMLDLEEAAKKDGAKVRPNGKKKDAKQLEDKKLIGEALKVAGVAVDLSGDVETVVSSASGAGGMKDVVAVISSLGKTMMEHWKQEGELKFLEALPTPEKKGIKTEMAKVQLLEIEAKRRRLEREAQAEQLLLLEDQEKLAAATAAAAAKAAATATAAASAGPPTREVEAVSRNSVSSLGEDEESPNKSCCAGSQYCYADEPDLEPLAIECLKCRGKAHQPCSRKIHGEIFLCYKCYWKEGP